MNFDDGRCYPLNDRTLNSSLKGQIDAAAKVEAEVKGGDDDVGGGDIGGEPNASDIACTKAAATSGSV
eukprot:16449040-Heterocapsa_arctica.AAC.1